MKKKQFFKLWAILAETRLSIKREKQVVQRKEGRTEAQGLYERKYK